MKMIVVVTLLVLLAVPSYAIRVADIQDGLNELKSLDESIKKLKIVYDDACKIYDDDDPRPAKPSTIKWNSCTQLTNTEKKLLNDTGACEGIRRAITKQEEKKDSLEVKQR